MSPRKHRVLRACALHLCSRQPASGLLRPPPKPRCPVRGGDRWPRRGPPAAPSPGGLFTGPTRLAAARAQRPGKRTSHSLRVPWEGLGRNQELRSGFACPARGPWQPRRECVWLSKHHRDSFPGGDHLHLSDTCPGTPPHPGAQPFPLGPSGRPVALHLGGRRGLKPRQRQSSRGTRTSSGTSLRSLRGPRAHA